MTLDELYETMLGKASEIELTQPASAAIVVEITGDDPRVWQVDVVGTKLAVKEGQTEGQDPSLKIVTSGDVLLKVASNKMKPATAFFTGKIKVKGDMALLSHLKTLWPQT
ncbi:MAG: SCP2 sterol-binding domain-containing protein [Deltaproteobacteria bacterium]|jgi:putative sterol carrier protein|nr:SCP2 sterol-binding domain-containing protein [Deltaproteobacteria bacterium]